MYKGGIIVMFIWPKIDLDRPISLEEQAKSFYENLDILERQNCRNELAKITMSFMAIGVVKRLG